jgi:hypothetical protein
MDQKRCSFPDKTLVNRYPTHFPISRYRGFWRKTGLKGWARGLGCGVVGGWEHGCRSA